MKIPDRMVIVNVGARIFYDTAISQKADAVHVNWRPTIKLEKDLEAILRRIGG